MRPETAIQIQIVETLSTLAGEHEFFFFSIPNEGPMLTALIDPKNKPVAARVLGPLVATFKKMGMTPGVPDLCIVQDARAYFLEVKTSGGVLTPAQRAVHQRLTFCGCPVSVVRSVDEMVHHLEWWGIIP